MMPKYEAGSSFLHRLDPITKLTALAAYSISIFLFDSIPFEVACFLLMLLTAYAIKSKSALSPIKSMYVVTLFIWLVFVQAIFTPYGTPYFSIPLHFINLPITDIGVSKGLLIGFRFLTIIIGSGLFVATTDPADLAYALMRSGIPYRYGFMLVTALRFIPVFQSEINTVSNAQKARGLDIDKGDVKTLLKSIQYTFVPMIVSALSKVDVLAVSMEGRAFGYAKGRTFLHTRKLMPLDMGIIVISIAIVVVLFLNVQAHWFLLPHLGV